MIIKRNICKAPAALRYIARGGLYLQPENILLWHKADLFQSALQNPCVKARCPREGRPDQSPHAGGKEYIAWRGQSPAKEAERPPATPEGRLEHK